MDAGEVHCCSGSCAIGTNDVVHQVGVAALAVRLQDAEPRRLDRDRLTQYAKTRRDNEADPELRAEWAAALGEARQ